MIQTSLYMSTVFSSFIHSELIVEKQYSSINNHGCLSQTRLTQCIDYILDLCITGLSARCAVALRLTRISSSTASNAVDACGHQQSVEEPLIKKSKSAREVQVVRKYRQSFPTHWPPLHSIFPQVNSK